MNKFIQDLKGKLSEWMRDKQGIGEINLFNRNFTLSIMLIESFTDFVELHNRLSTEFKSSENITKTQIHCLEMFGKFVSEYEFKIKASSEEVLDEIRRLNDSYASCHIKLWNSKNKNRGRNQRLAGSFKRRISC